MQNLLIVGATGFIGSHLAMEAKKRNYNLVVATRAQSNFNFLQKQQIKSFTLNLSNTADLEVQCAALISKHGKPDYIIYNVGCTQTHDYQKYYQVNNGYLQNFISVLSQLKAYPKKMLFSSSLAVHPPAKVESQHHITENSPLAAATHYGKSKIEAERYLKNITAFQVVIARPTAVYGPGDLNFLSLVKSLKNKIEIYAIRKNQRISLIFIDDLVSAYYDLLFDENTLGAYIISDGRSYTTREFNKIIKSYLKVKTLQIVLPISLLKELAVLNGLLDRIRGKASIFNRDKVSDLAAFSWECQNKKLQEQTGFKPRFNLQEGLHITLKWYQENGYI